MNTTHSYAIVLPYGSFFSFIHNFAKLSKYKIEIEINSASDKEQHLHAIASIKLYKNNSNPEDILPFIINYMRRNPNNVYKYVSPHIDKNVVEALISQLRKIYPEYDMDIEKEDFKYYTKDELSNQIINIVKTVKWEGGKCSLDTPFIVF